MVVRELFTSFGLSVNAADFAAADLLVSGLKAGLQLVLDGAKRAGQALSDVVLGTADIGDRVDELAQSTGVTTDQIQELAYAAKFSGVGMEELGQSMQQLARRGVRDVRGEMLRMADQFARMPNDGRKAELAMERFGRAGARMVPLLNEGREKLEQLFAEAPKLSPEAVAASAALNDTFDRLRGTFQEISFTIAGPLLKPLRQVVERFRDWVVANKQLIATGITKTLEVLGAIASGLITTVTFLVDQWKLVALVLASVGIAFGILGWAAITAALSAAAAWVVALWPLIAMAAAVALVILVLEDLYQLFTGGESVIAEFAEYLTKNVPKAFAFVADAIANAFTWAIDKVKGLFASLWEWIVVQVSALGSRISQGMVDGARGMLSLMPGGAAMSNALFGGGASPAASAASAVGTGPAAASGAVANFTAPITINATPGQDEAAIASQVRNQLEDFYRTKASETIAAVEGG